MGADVGGRWQPVYGKRRRLQLRRIGSRSVAFGKLVGDDPNRLKGSTISDMGAMAGSRPGRTRPTGRRLIPIAWTAFSTCSPPAVFIPSRLPTHTTGTFSAIRASSNPPGRRRPSSQLCTNLGETLRAAAKTDWEILSRRRSAATRLGDAGGGGSGSVVVRRLNSPRE